MKDQCLKDQLCFLMLGEIEHAFDVPPELTQRIQSFVRIGLLFDVLRDYDDTLDRRKWAAYELAKMERDMLIVSVGSRLARQLSLLSLGSITVHALSIWWQDGHGDIARRLVIVPFKYREEPSPIVPFKYSPTVSLGLLLKSSWLWLALSYTTGTWPIVCYASHDDGPSV